MQGFSPSPAPRRTVYKRAPSQEISPRRRSLKPSGHRGMSRLSTPGRTSERFSSVPDDESVASAMDVDESMEYVERALKFDTIFAKSEELQATFYAHLPVEVKQVLRNADFYQDAYTGQVDTESGFALVASAEKCFVWNYSQALTGTPTCYIFACPQDTQTLSMDTSLHAFVPYGISREPGLILLSSGGSFWFWDSLAMGLAGGEPSFTSALQLSGDERATTLTRADPQTFIVSTSIGRLFRLVLTATGGRHQIASRAFNRPTSMLSLTRLFPMLSSPANQVEAGNINAVALDPHSLDATGRDVWTLIDFRIQRWRMSTEGWEELTLDSDVSSLIAPEIRAKLTSTLHDADLDLELLDLQVIGEKELLILVSFAGQEDAMVMDGMPQPRRIYAIVPISHASESFEISEKGVQKVPYQSTTSSGAPMHPRMQLLLGGKVVSIQFGDTVVLCSPETEYTDRLELKSASDRTLGVGVVHANDESDLMVLTAATLMKVSIDSEKVEQFHAATGKANLIKSTMTQAILYGSHPENPLHFSFPPDVDADALMTGAEQLSFAIMESDVNVVRPNHDLHAQLTHRKERLSFLIKFINDNGVLTKMAQRSRQCLATDAEKLYAAHQLWLSHNQALSTGHSHSVLTEAVYLYMNRVGEGYHEDYMRAFFRLKIQDIGSLLPLVNEIINRSSREITHDLKNNVPQANDIVLTVLQSALDYREYNRGVYGIELPLIEPWTGRPAVINVVSDLFDVTANLVESSSSDAESSPARQQAKAQLPELGTTLFACYSEWLQWLESPIAQSEPLTQRERADLDERFRQSRPVILETLRRNGFANEAFRLAEKYRDFRSLASLCHKETIYPPENNPYARRIQGYVEKFKEAFTTELYQWYIEHGELRTMYAQEQSEYLDRFFAEHPYPGVSWIHDLGRERYRAAADSLLQEADHAAELPAKQLMLSIGKLAYLAQVQENDLTIDEEVLNAFHDGLDFVSVHEALLRELREPLAKVRQRQSLDNQVDTIAKSEASRLVPRKALYAIFKQLARRLLQGKALSIEDAADALSLKDNAEEEKLKDYVTALRLLVNAEIPQARKLAAFRSVWRRIYLHDNWNQIRQTAGATDNQVTERFRNTALHAAFMGTLDITAEHPEGYILLPREAAVPPTSAEVSSRWPGMPSEDVAALVRDYEWECRTLAELGLEDVVERVRELAMEDAAQWQ